MGDSILATLSLLLSPYLNTIGDALIKYVYKVLVGEERSKNGRGPNLVTLSVFPFPGEKSIINIVDGC